MHRKSRWHNPPHLKDSSGMSSSAVSSPGLVNIDGLFCKCVFSSVYLLLLLHYDWYNVMYKQQKMSGCTCMFAAILSK